MSSYIVDKEHIEQIVLYAYKIDCIGSNGKYFEFYHKKKCYQFANLSDIAYELSSANCEGVNYRYDEDNKPYIFDDLNINKLKLKNPLQVIKHVQCLEYQSCDIPSFDESLAQSILNTIRNKVINYVIDEECKRHCTESWKIWEYDENNILDWVNVQVVHKSSEVA